MLAYDLENRLVSGTLGSAGLDLTYDPEGRLLRTSAGGGAAGVRLFQYAGDQLATEYSLSGDILARYVPGPNPDEPLVWYDGPGTQRRWLFADAQGSIIGRTNPNLAANAQIMTYGPYGEPGDGSAAAWSGPRHRYTGQIALPELKLYHYKARAYDPATGRFTQTDPIGDESDLNLYAYVGGDPVNETDPTGMCGTPVCVREMEAELKTRQGSSLDYVKGVVAGALNATFESLSISQIEVQANIPSPNTANGTIGAAVGAAVATAATTLLDPSPAGEARLAREGATTITRGLEGRGVVPKAGERTLNGYVEARVRAAGKEVNMTRPSGNPAGRVGPPGRHHIPGPHVHKPYRNPLPNGGARIGVQGRAVAVDQKTVKELAKVP